MKTIDKVIKKGAPIIHLLLLLATQVLVSQELLKPVLQFTNACASNSFNTYEVEVTYIASTFNTNNTFSLELSNDSGDFTTPIVLKTISNQNNTFRFTTTFNLPQNTAGKEYKIRVKSSSPEKISPESDAFEAYFMSSEMLVLNNFENVVLCDGESKEISVNTSTTNQLQWYKNGEKLVLDDASIAVSEAGQYYCEIYYGSCSSPATSNIIEVSKNDAIVAEIKGDAVVALCENESYTLEATVDNNLYTYSWFKNGVKLENLPNYSPSITVSNPTAIGTYSLEITNENGCSGTSNEVKIESVNTNFSVSTTSTTSTFILTGETKELEISHTAQNPEISWFKDNIPILNSNSTSLPITESGVYFATVKNTVNNCSETKFSESITVSSITSFDAIIKTLPDYSECSSIKTQLFLESVKGRDVNDVIYDLTDSQIKLLSLNWHKNSIPLVGFTEKQITIETYEQNASYTLEVKNGTVQSFSNELDIQLGVLKPEITSNDNTNVFCDSKNITLSTTQQNAVTYQWFFNGSAIANATNTTLNVAAAGVYQIEVTNQTGCSKLSPEYTISAFDSNFSVSSSTASPTFILAGETKTLTLSHNAQNGVITWFKDNIEIPNSNTNNLTINEPGVYFASVTNTVNGCSETKSIDNIVVNASESFTAIIKTLPNYSECSSLQTQLFLDNVQVKDTNGRFYVLTSEQIALLEFRWFKDSILVSGANSRQITVDGYEQNGTYFLEIVNGAISSQSNVLDIKLGLPEITITSNDASNSLCNGKVINLTATAINGISYQWFFNGSAISGATNTTLIATEIGNYAVEVSGFGCNKIAQEFAITPFDETSITFHFDDEITIQEGESIIVSASGADSYEWFNENNESIGTSSSIEINKAGNYSVVAYLNGCSVEKFFLVNVVSGNVFVPNILTPNGDGINDYWKIPSEFAFKNNIEIEIISISGKTVLKQKNYQNNWPEDSANTASLYFYIIREEQNIIKKGTINILK